MSEPTSPEIDAWMPEFERPVDFRSEIEGILNNHSMENGSNTPDFILAEYLIDCLQAWDKASRAREKWYGKELSIQT